MSEPEAERDEYARFEELARKVVNTPKPAPDSAGSAGGEAADDESERERT